MNDIAPDIVVPLERDAKLQLVQGPGLDYTYVGLNLQDPLLRDVRVRQALAYAIDRQAIVQYLRRGLAVPADGMLPALSWAHASGLTSYPHDPARARALLDEAGHPDPDGNGPQPRFALSLKVSNTEFNRLQSSVIQQNLRRRRHRPRRSDIRVRDALCRRPRGQLPALHAAMDGWVACRPRHPPPRVPLESDASRRVQPRSLYRSRGSIRCSTKPPLPPMSRASRTLREVQRLLSSEVPYISLWHKTNFIMAQRSLDGLRVSPLGDLEFLKTPMLVVDQRL